jgi:hypothetical protein
MKNYVLILNINLFRNPESGDKKTNISQDFCIYFIMILLHFVYYKLFEFSTYLFIITVKCKTAYLKNNIELIAFFIVLSM